MSAAENAPQQTVSKQLVETIAAAVVAANRQVQQDSGERPFETRMPSRVSAFNPEGHVKRPKLTRKVVFCCHEENEHELSNREIELYNQIRPGRYNKRKWEVIEREALVAGDMKMLEIRIPVDTPDARMELAYTAGSLLQILQLMIDEAKAGEAKA